MKFVIGIDGGGTKTECLLADENGVIVASSVGGSTNLNVIKSTLLSQTLELLLSQLREQAANPYSEVTHIFAGISGVGNENNKSEIMRSLTELVSETVQVEVYSDPINALYSGTFGEPGIVQISGTGSITYGINTDHKHERVGGWGYLFGDEGSGYDIGKQGIIASLKAFDGRGQETILLDMLYEHFHVKDGHELIHEIYTSPMPKDKIAPISQIVLQAYKLDDTVAQKIVRNVAKELVSSTTTLHKKLFQENEQVKLVLCGGVFTEKSIIPRLMEQELNQGEFSIIIPEISPVGGSLVGAYLSMGRRIDKNVLKNMKKNR